MSEDPTTRELRVEQVQRELRHRRAAEDAPDDEEARRHDRRAERAAYLREKLEERASSERDAG